MKQPAKFSVVGALLAVVAAIFYPQLSQSAGTATSSGPPAAVSAPATPSSTPTLPTPTPPATAPKATKPAPTAQAKATTSSVGFTSRRSWEEHFAKHGAEFGKVTADEYLALAQTLRDAPLSTTVLELVRDDGVISRFDQKSGGFVAFHEDKSIRTFFRPNDGEAYFKRQAQR